MTSEPIQRQAASPDRVEQQHHAAAVPEHAGDHWRAVLGAQSPREILARLLQGDPLELRRVVASRLAARAYLFDADRVHLRALAHCARYGVRYRGTPPLQTWLEEIVDQALLDLLQEDLARERRTEPCDAEDLAAFVDLARPLGLEPAVMRRVCVAHNSLRDPERQAFHGLVIAGRELEELARTMGSSGVEVARLARRGLEVVLIAAGQASPPPARDRKSGPAAAVDRSPTEAAPSIPPASPTLIPPNSQSFDEVQP